MLDLHITHTETLLGVCVVAHTGDKLIGAMELTGEWAHINHGRFVRYIEVDHDYRRQGVATALWAYAIEAGLNPHHDLTKTEDGSKWAAAQEVR